MPDMPTGTGEECQPNREGPCSHSHSTAAPTSSDSSSSTVRTKIQERLHSVVRDASLTKNRSPELIPLMREYEGMRKKLRAFVASVKYYGEQTKCMNNARAELVRNMAIMSSNSPLEGDIASELSPEVQQSLTNATHGEASDALSTAELLRQSEPKSLVQVQGFATAYAISNQHDYQQHVAAYAETWEIVATETADNLINKVRKLQGDRDHYEKKVYGLRKQANALEVKGKSSPPRALTRLVRNEEKLKEAFVIYETEACRLCSLIEAITHDGWIELQALCRNYIKWESNRVGRESDTYAFLAHVLESVKITSKKSTRKRNNPVKTKPTKSLSEPEDVIG